MRRMKYITTASGEPKANSEMLKKLRRGFRSAKPVVLAICQLPPPVHGAAIVNSLVVDSTLVNDSISLTVIEISTSTSIAAVRKLQPRKILPTLLLYHRVIKALFKINPDLVYFPASVHGPALFRDTILIVIVRAIGIPLLLHIHTQGVRLRYEKSAFYRFIYRILFRQVDVIQLSDMLYEDISMVVPRARVHVIPNALPQDNSSVNRFEVTEGAVPRILFLSNYMEAKGPLDLLDASELLFARGIPHSITFVGASSDARVESKLRSVARLYPDRIRVLGPAYGASKRELFEESDILAFPSWSECQPLVVLEAMAAGLAIVGTAVGSIPDMLKYECGLVVPARSPGHLADALEIVCKSKSLRSNLGTAARARYEQDFSLRKFEDNISTLMLRLHRNNA